MPLRIVREQALLRRQPLDGRLPGGLDSLKTQMNMAIGIRCLYAIAIWCLQRFPNKMIPNTYNGRRRGEYVWFTIMWGFVMWHWKHGNGQNNPSYKSVKSQLGAMDSIYTRGDTPLLSNWTYKNYIYCYEIRYITIF